MPSTKDHNVHKTKQRRRLRQQQQQPPPYTQEQIKAIAADVKSGTIAHPDLDLHSSDEWEALWALVDTGSSINAADCPKVIPGAVVQPSPSNKSTYATANGGQLKNRGQVTTQARTQEGHNRTIVWQNVEIDMPILSTSGLCPEDGDLVGYHNKGGVIYNHKTRHIGKFVREGNVYFMKVLVPRKLVKPPAEDKGPVPASEAQPSAPRSILKTTAEAAGNCPKAKAPSFVGQAGAWRAAALLPRL